MDLSVVIPTYNRALLLGGTLEALCTQRVPVSLSWEVVVVDNNCRDGTRALVDTVARQAPVSVRHCCELRQGANCARNAGIAAARGSVIAFTDDDVIPREDWVVSVAEAMRRWNADVVGGRVLPKWEVPPPRWLMESGRLRADLSLMEWTEARVLAFPMRGVPQVWGSNMVFRRAVFDAVGLFDPRRGTMGGKLYRGDEVELINRALGHGLRVAYDPALTVFHRIGPDRMRRAYFRRMAIDREEGEALVEGAPKGVYLFGAPRWQYRRVARELARWVGRTALGRPNRFECELDLLGELGRLRGHWKRQRQDSTGVA